MRRQADLTDLGLSRAMMVAALLAAPGRVAAEPVLHEYVPPPGQSAAVSWSRQGQLPANIRVDDQTLSRPSDPLQARSGQERVLDADTAAPEQTMRPDRSTSQDGVLHYQAVFNPSVVPFKRGNAFDAVGPRYVMGVRDRRLTPLRIARSPTSPDRDLFWGSLALKVDSPERPIQIPSVAPEARILSYSATPRATVQFFKDSSDNVWVKVRGARGPCRLVFLTDAPKRYFAPQIPPSVTAAHVPTALRPLLAGPLRAAAERVIQRVGVKRADTIFNQLERLTAYFRNFKPGPLPRITGDTYLDIALSQQGVCRHRSFAFVVTAQALGIPARFVHNDAHAFTEVFVPRLGWARIDLGGASLGLQVYNAQQKSVHNPGPDPFPRPSRFTHNYSRLAGSSVRGIRPEQRLRRARPRVALSSFDRSRGAGQPGRSGTSATGHGDRSATTAAGTDPAGEPGEPGADAAEPGERGEPQIAPRKSSTHIVVYTNARSVYRGEQIVVWGGVKSNGGGAPGLKIQIFLSQQGRRGLGDALGDTVTDPEGNFRVALPVPRSMKVGQWRVYAATEGDSRFEASLSQ